MSLLLGDLVDKQLPAARGNTYTEQTRRKFGNTKYTVFQTDHFNVNKGDYIELRTVTVTVWSRG
jgi:hypothetical protein